MKGKKLRHLLSRADDESFFQLVWAVDALQSDRVSAARKYLKFPAAAATSDIGAQSAIHSWELETLISQLLTTPKLERREGKNRLVNCSTFAAAAAATNLLRGIEDAEAGIYLRNNPVLNELHRIGQRIFPWQRGYFNTPQFYRSAFIYGQGMCAEHFRAKFGLTTDEFSLVGFGLRSFFQEHPTIPGFSMEEAGISRVVMEAALKLLVMPADVARKEAASLATIVSEKHQHLPIAYRPSLIRKFPVISFGIGGERLRSPLPELILLRVTSGLYYDLVGGDSHLRNEASDRFEAYCQKFIAAMLSGFNVSRSHQYKLQSKNVDSPDLIVKENGKAVIVIECKATKLTFGAQFSSDPVAEAAAGYDELAKGIFQIWRYFSHARQGIVSTEILSDTRAIILTLDTWLVMSRKLQSDLFAKAEVLANKDPGIQAIDRRKVVFCTIQDLESVLTQSSEARFLDVVSAAAEDRFIGWLLPNIHSELGKDTSERRPYPFDLEEVMPSWKKIKEIRSREQLT